MNHLLNRGYLMVLAQHFMKTLAQAWLKKAFLSPGKLGVLMVLAMMISGFTPSLSAKNVLFISEYDLGSLNSGDQAIYDRLVALGHTVTLKGSSSNPASTADATGQDLVFISSTINSGDINTKFRDVSIPVIVNEPWLLDDMKMVYNDGNHQGGWTSQTQMTIDMASHPLAAGLSGTVNILNPSEAMRWGMPNSNSEKIARLTSSTDKYGVFCYRPGAWMEGMNAPALRIGFFLDNNTAANLTNDGWTLFDNCISMASGGHPSSAYVVKTCDILNYGTSGRSFWIPLPGHDTGNEKLYTFISGGQLVEYSDGSATIQGVIENLADPSYKWEVDMRFINKKNWTQWSAMGRLAKNDWLGDETTWEYYEMDGTASKMTGQGGFAGKTLYLSNNPSNFTYGLQVGDGANAMNSAPGLSQWFYFHGSYSGNGDINAEKTCTIPPMPCEGNTLAYWDLDACQAWSNASDYSEFTPVFPDTSSLHTITGTIAYRNSGYNHSCNPGVDGDPAICFSSRDGCTFYDNSNYALRFDVTVNPTAGFPTKISGLSFFEKAPNTWIQYNSSGTGFNTGTNNPPSKYGVRVTVNGTEVFKQVDMMTTTDWTLENIDFSNDPDFTITSTTTFSFELLGYCTDPNGGSMTAWDIDEIKVMGCTDPGCVILDPGEVGPDQENCGPYDPDPIPSISLPDGGNGDFEYEWFYSLDKNLPFEMWVPEPNSNSPTYDPHFIDKTCWLVRCVKRAGCDSVYYSNIVVVKVKEFPKAEFVVPGAVCNDSLVTITAETANGDSVAYNWTFENGTPPSALGQSVQVKWTVAGTYNITLDVNRFDCVSSLTQPIMIDNCVVCDNITGGGSINGGDATCVIPYDPAPLTNNNLPSTGSGPLEFVWLTTTDPSLPQNQWTMIPNSNSQDYDPGPLSETTYFLRCVRRQGCDSYKESNVVKIEVVEGAHNLCKPTNFDMGNGDMSIELGIIEGTTTGKYYFSENDRQFVVYTDSTAVLKGLLIHSENSNQRWYAEIWFKNYMDWGDWSSLGRKAWPGNYNTNKSTWDYYEIDASKSTLTGKQWFKNKVINLSNNPTNNSKGFQVGEGANTYSGDYGAYGKFSYNGSYGGSGEIKVSFEGCQDVCTPAPKIAMTTFLEAAYDPAEGEMRTDLVENGLLPSSQPFTGAPWNYAGTEAIEAGANTDSIVDWMLLVAIDASTNTVMGKKAVLLDKHGFLREASNATSLATFDGLDPDLAYYFTVCSRTHLDISTNNSISRMGRVMLQDFTEANAAYSIAGYPNAPLNTMSDGTPAMIMGDLNGDLFVNATDLSFVYLQFFLFAYITGDGNLDGFVNGVDAQQVVNRFFNFGQTR